MMYTSQLKKNTHMTGFVVQGHIFYIPNPTQYLNLTIILLTISNQQIRSLLRQKSYVIVC